MNIVKGLTNIIPVIRTSATRGYAMRSDLKIKWVRPEKISCIKVKIEINFGRKLEIIKKRIKTFIDIWGMNPIAK